ncbi:LytR/AlgR family response regulator transcription factor [Miniphocaeibacter halophilus]|uniref:Response regulator transcription factor n=1 Tax=Miniphocaeibacter halophilus TaxID=2931922 RepID=A0AC61MMM1_9FIRM|nr:LytTR family DNA-binding domain-containing protein [Miniphocaeibacter halophilus]QQK06924.1 response regulator transcription factor [Miniphocaeibacter halophilus]
MLRIAICDDEKKARFSLYTGLERVLENKEIEYVIYEFPSGEKLIDWYEKHSDEVDLVFLDIEMPGPDGMEVAKKLRKRSSILQIVFITSYPDYVFDGYLVDAMGYLLKPVKEKDLINIINRSLAKILQNENDVFTFKNMKGIFRIPKIDILYFQSEGRKINCITRDSNYVFYEKLNNIEKSIGPAFLRIHQSYLINSKHVDQAKAESVLVNGKELPISRQYRKTALLELGRNLLN